MSSIKNENCLYWMQVHDASIPQFLPEVQKVFLHAIANGAKFIFAPRGNKADVERTLTEILRLVESPPGRVFAALEDDDFFRATDYFACDSKSDVCLKTFSVCSSGTPSIISPAYVESGGGSTLCDSRMPQIALSPHSYTSISLKLSTFGYLSFWMLPVFYDYYADAGRLDPELIRIVQRLLWQQGGFVETFRSDVREEPRTRRDSTQFSTSCRRRSNMADCIVTTMTDILPAEYFEDFKNWISILRMRGYRFEGRKFSSHTCSKVVLNLADFCISEQSIKFGQHLAVANLDKIKDDYRTTCSDLPHLISSPNFNKPWFQKPNILLVIVFNNPHYGVIPYLEMLYRPFYPIVFYCGPEFPDIKRHPNLKGYFFSFVTFDLQPSGRPPGALNYQCILKVLQLNLKVDGYMSVADDLLLMNHQVPRLDVKVPWFIPKRELKIGDLTSMKECRLGICDFYNLWRWWEDYRNESLALLTDLESLGRRSVEFALLQRTLESFTGGKGRLIGGYSDVFYVPKNLSRQFVIVGELFLKHRVFVEIAVPSIIWSFTTSRDVRPLQGLQVWNAETRDRPWLHFKRSHLFGKFYFHPMKWSSVGRRDSMEENDYPTNNLSSDNGYEIELRYNLNNSAEMTRLLCRSVLPYFHDPVGRLPG